jgi:hypothetical protein
LGAAQNRRVIAFATFFLGIVFGLSTVELVPGEGVSRVELYLDGTRVAELWVSSGAAVREARSST